MVAPTRVSEGTPQEPAAAGGPGSATAELTQAEAVTEDPAGPAGDLKGARGNGVQRRNGARGNGAAETAPAETERGRAERRPRKRRLRNQQLRKR